ncbi:uncharacterized protein [Diabrotica undecimpunctata]|uniref:uncharacterized protein n=1 Tax=Diabrotica undecimpunctata TaxID=50387 RepID=UPI003B63B615
MINKRLLWHFEKHKIIPKEHSGYQRQRSIKDNVVLLQTYISNAINSQQDLIATIFDIAGACDSINAIVDKLSQCIITGNIYAFIKNFLRSSFRVPVNNFLSPPHVQNNGVPQGSVFSKLSQNVAPPIKCVLYADDLIIYCHGKSKVTTSKILQLAVNDLQNKLASLGLPSPTLQSH